MAYDIIRLDRPTLLAGRLISFLGAAKHFGNYWLNKWRSTDTAEKFKQLANERRSYKTRAYVFRQQAKMAYRRFRGRRGYGRRYKRRRLYRRSVRRPSWKRRIYRAFNRRSKGVVKYIDQSFKSQDATVLNDFWAGYNTAQAKELTTGISEGDDIGNRLGRKIILKALHFRGVVTGRLIATNSIYDIWTPMRLIVFWDQTGDTASANPALSEILAPDTTTGNNANWVSNIFALRVIDDSSKSTRFKVLKDKMFWLNNNDSTNPNSRPYKVINFNLKMRHPVEYTGTAGNQANKGAIYYFLLSEASTIGKNPPFFDCCWRMKWVDRLW